MTIAINEVVVPIALAIGRGVGGSHCHWWGWGAIGGGWGVPIAIDGGKVPITICIVGSGVPIVIGGGMPSDGVYSLIQLNIIQSLMLMQIMHIHWSTMYNIVELYLIL